MQNEKNQQQQQPQQQPREDETDLQNPENISENAAAEDDGSPVLNESDLEENNLSGEEADNVEWEDTKGNP